MERGPLLSLIFNPYMLDMNFHRYCLIVILITLTGNYLRAQNDSIVHPIELEIVTEFKDVDGDGPPCGIPCHYVYDKIGNFMECLSPCCNCNQLKTNFKILPPFLETDTVEVYNNKPTLLFNQEFSIRIDAILSDARCPKDVQCKWAGNAVIRFELIHLLYGNTFFKLNTNEFFSQDIILNNLYFKLIELDPYPKVSSKIKLKKYIATLAIQKR